MAQSDRSLVRRFDFLVDAVVVGAFFVLIFLLVRSHVPSNDPKMVALWAAAAASCMSGVFWLTLWMLRVVARYQQELKRRR